MVGIVLSFSVMFALGLVAHDGATEEILRKKIKDSIDRGSPVIAGGIVGPPDEGIMVGGKSYARKVTIQRLIEDDDGTLNVADPDDGDTDLKKMGNQLDKMSEKLSKIADKDTELMDIHAKLIH